eukprot:8231046-Alexandrium_andersonii.AAC.1
MYVHPKPCQGPGVIARVSGTLSGLVNGGIFATDGSGGRYTSSPRKRRCGWACVHLAPDCSDIMGSVWGPLPDKQTVPRAELYALVMLLQRVAGQ